MNWDIGNINQAAAKQIIDTLVEQGVDVFCLSPGSRSTSLVLALADHPKATSHVHFDERGMAFYAFGLAKATKKPVAIITTSGTAVGNLFPAIMEASLDNLPLIMLTADRPPELRNAGANQTVDQVKIFGSYVRKEFDLPCSNLPASYLAKTLSYAVFLAKALKGPIHLNCMFQEPFLPKQQSFFPVETGTKYLFSEQKIVEEDAKIFANLFSNKTGLFLLGEMHDATFFQQLQLLAHKTKWPILADILSGFRSLRNETIVHYHSILQTFSETEPDIILYLGQRIVSKHLLEWMKKRKKTKIIHVSEQFDRMDPHHIVDERVFTSPANFIQSILPHISENKNEEWLNQWKEWSQVLHQCKKSYFGNQEEISEVGIIELLRNSLNEKIALFFANSMPIRDADHLFFPENPIGPIFGKRAVSGIDGNIATCIGLANGLRMPIISVLGDQTFLHDLNSLAMVKKSKIPIIFLVINNGGGGIFSFLPISQKNEKIFERFFASAHSLSFEHSAKLFDIPYEKVIDNSHFSDLLADLVKNPRSMIVEVITDRKQNVLDHKKLDLAMKEALCTKLALVT
ncbi:MAG: 2-succinyl-5-enolpyruvyl-6-hydroxy-3-cyclohexene-1-carboxylic-acid synthase [Chlamydiae bacterium]|nr:2-succinyl-5-enolpyruvyl-6-hydroxy-3-cyclohexene-1-carboxylic-acid synthase [Chlamydiota bacterium]